MPDDTLSLLLNLDAAGALPPEYELDANGWLQGPYNHISMREVRTKQYVWVEPGASCFIVALQAHLAGMGVAVGMCGADVWFAGTWDAWSEQGLHGAISVQATGGPGVDSLLLAALAVVEATREA